MSRTARWLALVVYVAAVFTFLPLGPRVGVTLARTPGGAWFLGPGILALTALAVVGLLALLVRRGAPPYAYAMLVVAGAGYVAGFSWLRSQHLERTHLPEYGIAAWLAWRALAPSVVGRARGYVLAALLAAAIGYGDELLQRFVPGRVYDTRDVAMNAVGAVLGTIVLAAARAGSDAKAPATRAAAGDTAGLVRPPFSP
jgi:hypothetical protein